MSTSPTKITEYTESKTHEATVRDYRIQEDTCINVDFDDYQPKPQDHVVPQAIEQTPKIEPDFDMTNEDLESALQVEEGQIYDSMAE
jgi:hypothetical protein